MKLKTFFAQKGESTFYLQEVGYKKIFEVALNLTKFNIKHNKHMMIRGIILPFLRIIIKPKKYSCYITQQLFNHDN